VGGPAALWLLAATLRKRFGKPGERAFWVGLVLWSVVIGIAVVGERDPLGVAHLTLVPLAVLGMTLVASRFSSSRVLAWAVIAGCVIDFSLGVFLHARIQHLENTPDRPVFIGLVYGQGEFRTGPATEDSLSPMAWDNWMHKHQYRLAEEWRQSVDAFRPGDPALDRPRANAHRALDLMQHDDQKFWRGWYGRHGGEIVYLGDDFGSGDATSAVLLLLFAGLMWQLVRSMPRKPAAVVAPTPPVRKKPRKPPAQAASSGQPETPATDAHTGAGKPAAPKVRRASVAPEPGAAKPAAGETKKSSETVTPAAPAKPKPKPKPKPVAAKPPEQ